MDANLFKAILAMDAYNRGYDEGIKNLDSVGSQIGNAMITTDSLQTSTTANGISAGFYAIAYTYNGEKIISYRGMDDFFPSFWSDQPGTDPWNGWERTNENSATWLRLGEAASASSRRASAG